MSRAALSVNTFDKRQQFPVSGHKANLLPALVSVTSIVLLSAVVLVAY